MVKISSIIFISFICIHYLSEAQQSVKAEFNSSAWEIDADNHGFTEYKGKPSLYLENGDAIWKGSRFKNGIIDFDIIFEQGRMFPGIHFRMQDPENYEEFYVRPHQSGNPDAMQYTPVFNGTAGWQLYHGEGHSTAYHFNFEEWIHIRLIVTDNRMDVFINDMSQPVLQVHDLKMAAQSGEIGFGNFLGGAYFANLSYQELENPQLVSNVEKLPALEAGTIRAWQVSPAFADKELAAIYNLKSFKLKSKEWKRLPVEYTGLVNLSRISPVTDDINTILVRTTITSDKDQVKRLDFGYSDAARVFLNNEIMYSGQRKFRSRDYRYLGTIGYFDSVYLKLKKGKNEVVFAITESMGGWGLKAKLENMEGIELED